MKLRSALWAVVLLALGAISVTAEKNAPAPQEDSETAITSHVASAGMVTKRPRGPFETCSSCRACDEEHPDIARFDAETLEPPDPPDDEKWLGDLESVGNPCIQDFSCDDCHICCAEGLSCNNCAPSTPDGPAWSLDELLKLTDRPRAFAAYVTGHHLRIRMATERNSIQLLGCRDAVIASVPIEATLFTPLERTLARRIALQSKMQTVSSWLTARVADVRSTSHQWIIVLGLSLRRTTVA